MHARHRTALTRAALPLAALLPLGLAAPAAGATTAPGRSVTTPSLRATDSCPGAMQPVGISGFSGPGGFASVDSVGPDSVWAVGVMGAGSSARPLVVHGTDRGPVQPVQVPDLGTRGGSALTSVDVVSPTSVWMAGSGSLESPRIARPLVVHWKDGVMASLAIPDALLQGDSQRVQDLAASADDDVWVELYERTYSPRRTRYTTLHWDGHAWQRVELPTPRTPWKLAASSTSGAWAAGPGTVARWDGGTSWGVASSSTPPGYSGTTFAVLASNGRDVAIAYNASPFSGQEAVARWTGTSWSVLPGSRPLYGAPVVAPDGTLFLSGSRFYDSVFPLTRLVDEVQRWDGSHWTVSSIKDSQNIGTRQGGLLASANVFTATSSTAVTAVGYQGEAELSTTFPWMGRWCTSVVRSTSISHPGTTTLWDGPVTVRADASLAGDHAVVDAMGLFVPQPLTASGWADFSYPTAGTFTATVTGVRGATLTTTVPLEVSGTAIEGSLSLWWSHGAPPAGFHVEVQRAVDTVPTTYAPVVTPFDADHVALAPTPGGVQGFLYRARLVRQDGLVSGWSPAIPVLQ